MIGLEERAREGGHGFRVGERVGAQGLRGKRGGFGQLRRRRGLGQGQRSLQLQHARLQCVQLGGTGPVRQRCIAFLQQRHQTSNLFMRIGQSRLQLGSLGAGARARAQTLVDGGGCGRARADTGARDGCAAAGLGFSCGCAHIAGGGGSGGS